MYTQHSLCSKSEIATHASRHCAMHISTEIPAPSITLVAHGRADSSAHE